jgi:CBS domain-containing protein
MEVRELMSEPVYTVSIDDTLAGVVRLMREQGVGCVPVVDPDGQLCGIVTDRDVAFAAYSAGEALWRLSVDDHMRTPVYACYADDDVDAALMLLREHRLHRLPVIDADGRPIGLLSLDDLAEAARRPVDWPSHPQAG